MKKNEHCPFCGKESFHHQIKPLALHYKSHSITIEQPGYWCDACKEGVIGGEDRKATQKQLQAFRARVDRLITPDDIKRIREKLYLTQQKASEIFGGGVNAFSRYERGETPISKPLSQLLKLLDRHPNLLIELNKKPAKQHNKTNKNKLAAAG